MTLNSTDTIALVGVIVASGGVIVVLAQIYLAKRKERFDSTMWLFERFQEPEATNARFLSKSLLAKARKPATDKGTSEGFASIEYDFDQLLDPPERAQLASIGSLFGLAGLLYREHRIHRRLFLEAWGNSVIVNYERLAPYMRWRYDKLGPHRSLWRHFEFLAATAMLTRK